MGAGDAACVCVYSMSWLSVCVWIWLKGGRDVKLDVHPVCVCGFI